MTELKEFTRGDWFGLAGAEKFADGSEPQIARWNDGNVEIEVIADKNGISAILFSDNEWYSFSAYVEENTMPKEFTLILARKLISDIENLGTELRDYVTYFRTHYPEMQEDHDNC